MFKDLDMVVGQLYQELEFSKNSDLEFSKKINLFILQPTMSKVVLDVFEVLQTPLQNQTTLIKKVITLENTLEILAGKTEAFSKLL